MWKLTYGNLDLPENIGMRRIVTLMQNNGRFVAVFDRLGVNELFWQGLGFLIWARSCPKSKHIQVDGQSVEVRFQSGVFEQRRSKNNVY